MPSVLVGDESRCQIRRVAGELPADWVSFLGFEARLGSVSDAKRGDLAFNLSTEGLRRLSEQPFSNRWRRLARLCSQWGSRSTVPFANAGEMWIELDMAGQESWPAANVFLSPGREDETAGAAERSANVETCGWICRTAAETLMVKPPSQEVSRLLMDCVERARRPLRKVQIGMMSARAVDGLRLCLLGLSAEGVERLLTDIQWPGDRGLVSRRLRRYAPLIDDFGLHLDVGPAIYPSLGLELLFNRSPWHLQPTNEPRWESLLDALADRGTAREEEVAALLAWPGTTVDPAWLLQRALGEWAGLNEASATVEHGVWTRGLAYVKWTLSARGEEGAKAYFGTFSEQNRRPQLRDVGDPAVPNKDSFPDERP